MTKTNTNHRTGKAVLKTPRRDHEPPGIAEIPDMAYYDGYVERTDNGVGCYAVFDYARETKSNVLIVGPTGSGKTSAALAYAAREEMPFYSISSSVGLEPSQLFGRYIPDGAGGFMWQDGPVTYVVRHGGFLLINEINFIPDRVGTVLFSLLDKRRTIQLLDHKGEVLTAHEDLVIAADMNPGYAGTRTLNAALKNRFPIQLYWDYDPEVEEKLVPYPAVRNVLRSLRDSDEITTPVSTNMATELIQQAYSPLGYSFAAMSFVNHFALDEKSVVETVLDIHSVEVRQALFPNTQPTGHLDSQVWSPEDYDLSVVGTEENPNPINYPEWIEDMGIYRVHWRLDLEDEEAEIPESDDDQGVKW